MEMTTIHPAESYLRNETNPPSLYVRIAGIFSIPVLIILQPR